VVAPPSARAPRRDLLDPREAARRLARVMVSGIENDFAESGASLEAQIEEARALFDSCVLPELASLFDEALADRGLRSERRPPPAVIETGETGGWSRPAAEAGSGAWSEQTARPTLQPPPEQTERPTVDETSEPPWSWSRPPETSSPAPVAPGSEPDQDILAEAERTDERPPADFTGTPDTLVSTTPPASAEAPSMLPPEPPTVFDLPSMRQAQRGLQGNVSKRRLVLVAAAIAATTAAIVYHYLIAGF
jgi:hypothetical protein